MKEKQEHNSTAYCNMVSSTATRGHVACSGTLRTGTSSFARASRYHTNAIAVSDFTIATRKWAKSCIRRSVTRSENADQREGKLAEACMRFTTRDLTAGSLLRIVSNSYRFHAAVQIIFTCVTIT